FGLLYVFTLRLILLYTDTATSYIYTRSLHDALPISNDVGMLLLLSDYYGEKGEQLDKAETYAKKAISTVESSVKPEGVTDQQWTDRKSTRLNSSHGSISYAVFCLKKKIILHTT